MNTETCQCGCGNKTTVSKKTASDRGHVKGEPLKFIHGHNRRSMWKGDAVSYSGAHKRVRAERGKPDHCILCGTRYCSRYEWANLTGNYADVSDYEPMCVSCHKKFDYGRSPRSHCRKGHPYTVQNTIISRTGRWCRICRMMGQRERRPIQNPRKGQQWIDRMVSNA